MSISSSSAGVVQKVVAPVSESDNVSNKVKEELHSTYSAVHARQKEEVDDNGDDSKAPAPLTVSDEKVEEDALPEIFNLLQHERFEDFFSLALSKDDAKLCMIIKGSRKLRGVSKFLPLSSEHKSQDTFINRIKEQYLSTGWLMESKPGQKYSAFW